MHFQGWELLITVVFLYLTIKICTKIIVLFLQFFRINSAKKAQTFSIKIMYLPGEKAGILKFSDEQNVSNRMIKNVFLGLRIVKNNSSSLCLKTKKRAWIIAIFFQTFKINSPKKAQIFSF